MMPGDIYTEWLEVPAGKRPPDHYTLLGLPTFCDDMPAIEQAARKRLARLDRYAIHPDPKKRDACHRLMNEVARARVVLASSARKGPYDIQLAEKLGVEPPQEAAEFTEQDQPDENDTSAEAESYLQQLAQAASDKSTPRPTRRAKRPSWPIPVGVGAIVVLLAIGAWFLFKPTSQSPVKVAMQNPPPATGPAAPPVVSPTPIPPPAPTINPRAVAVVSVTPPAAPPALPHPAPDVHLNPTPKTEHVAAAQDASPLAALNASLNRLTDWTVEEGIWSIVETGRLRGEGPSDIDFDPDLPPNATISFHMCVVKGMRPRIRFNGPDIYVGNEGYSRKINVHGKVKDLTGDALDYKNGEEIAVRVSFIGNDHFEVHLNDDVLTGTCQPHAKIHLRLSAGDWWSKGTTDFWDMHITTGAPIEDHPVEPPTEKPVEKPAVPPVRKGLFDQ